MDMKEQLNQALAKACEAITAKGTFQLTPLPEIKLEIPPQKEFGHYATNLAMQLARVAKANPRQIAQAIADELKEPFLDKVEIAGPGFINFYLKDNYWYELLATMLQQGEKYGCTQFGQGEKVQVEYVSANPTGPLHVGHGRGAAVGSALVNLLRAAGYDVKSEYYINDAGNQIDNLAASVEARYLELLERNVEFPENGYHGQDIIETAKRILDNAGTRYLMMMPKDRLAVFKEYALSEKLVALREDLEDFNVDFDVWFSERTLHEQGLIKKACDVLKERGYMYEQDGALWLKSTEYGDDKDRVVIRDNGVPTYLAADIAYHHNKFERGFDRVINIWGADHHGYIARVKAAVEALGHDANQLEVLILQMVNLYRNGELVKMSKRTGQSVTLNELMEEVGTDAARYFFIMRSIDSQLDFDLTLATSRTNENPVYYIQYAHARICSIFRQLAENKIDVKPINQVDLSALTEECELDLIKKMAEYPNEISQAARERAPHRIARYVHELASLFHSFYNQCRILGEAETVQQARIQLVQAVQNILKHALHILGISAPDHM